MYFPQENVSVHTLPNSIQMLVSVWAHLISIQKQLDLNALKILFSTWNGQ